MKTLLRIIRDPIWQAVGVLVSVLGIFLATSNPSPANGELAIIRTHSIRFSDYLLPSKLLKLDLKKASKNMDEATVDYFTIVNRGNKPILPTDYMASLKAELKSGGEIFLVDSCTEPTESPSKKSTSSCPPGSFVSSTWQQHDQTWVQEPALLNPGEQFCVIVIRKSPSEQSNALVGWGGRIAGAKIATYTSLEEYGKSLEKNTTYYLQTNIRLDGFAACWFVALQIAAFCATLLLARQAHWHHTKFGSSIWPAAIAMLLATSTSEILVDIFINQNTSNLHPVVWPLLFIHSSLLIYLLFQALRARLLPARPTIPRVDP